MKTRTILPVAVFAALVVVAGVVHGLHTDRWRASADLDDAIKRLEQVPATIGDWHGKKQVFDAEDLRRSGIKGHTAYRYRNIITGEVVTMLIVCGRPGPIAVHTPDVCYGGAGYTALGDQQRKELAAPGGRPFFVWALRFKTPATLNSSQIEVNWTWNGGDGWKAPDNSRLALAGHRVMYKLYAVRDLPLLASSNRRDASEAFLRIALPELEKILSR